MMSMVTRKSVMYMQLIILGCFTSPIHFSKHSESLQKNKQQYLLSMTSHIRSLSLNRHCNVLQVETDWPPGLIIVTVLRWLIRKQKTCFNNAFMKKEIIPCPPCSPAAVCTVIDLSIKEWFISLKEVNPGAEDDDVVCCGGHSEEEHFKLEAHSQEDSTCNKW